MPFGVRQQSCTDSAGKHGSYVVYRLDTGAKVSCHGTRIAAEAARRIRTARSEDRAIDPEDIRTLAIDTFCCDIGEMLLEENST